MKAAALIKYRVILMTLLCLFPAQIETSMATAVESAFAQAPRRQFVNSLADFRDHMHSHIERVVLLGMELLKQHPHGYEDVDRGLLRRFLMIHDFSKVHPELTSAGEKDRGERLYAYYGVNFSTADSEFRAASQKLVNELNTVDARVARNFFESENVGGRFINAQGEYTELALKFLSIERIADQVDRGMNPVAVEEFQRVMSRASQFLRDPAEAALARLLESEEVYQNVIRSSTFEAYRLRMREGDIRCRQKWGGVAR